MRTKKNQLALYILTIFIFIAIPVSSVIGAVGASTTSDRPLQQATSTPIPSYYAIEKDIVTVVNVANDGQNSGDSVPVTIEATHNGDPLVAVVGYTEKAAGGTSSGYCYTIKQDASGDYWGSTATPGGIVRGAKAIGGRPQSLLDWLAAHYPSYSLASGYTSNPVPNSMLGLYAEYRTTNSAAAYTCNGQLIAVYQSLQPTATPTPYCKDVVGTWRTIDLIANGNVGSGALTANQALINGSNYYVIDFTITATTPRMLDGYTQAILTVGIDDPGTHKTYGQPGNYIVTVDGIPFIGPGDGSSVQIAVKGGTQITIQYHAEIPGSPSVSDTMKVYAMSLKIPTYLDPGSNLLCDAGMEQWYASDYWGMYRGSTWGRLNSTYLTNWENLNNGTAYCSAGMQAVGTFYLQTGQTFYDGSPILQNFHWAGGLAYWKFRAAAGHLGSKAHVWIKDTAGTNVADLYYGNLPGFVIKPIWSLKSGHFDLDPGDYQIVLDMDTSPGATVYYDDVAIGSQIVTDCQEDMKVVPTMPTPTRTATNQATPTRTRTLALTPYKTSTGTVTLTATQVSTITTTARPTRTITSTLTPNHDPSPVARTPTLTKTPYGTPQNSATPDPNATPNGTPTEEWVWTGGDPPPGGDQPGNGVCTQPSNAWSLSWWLDYEVCRIFYAVSWQPAHSATLVAVPNVFGTVEPFNSIKKISNGIDDMSTQVATYVYNATPFVNAAGPQTPSPSIFNPGGIWTGQTPFTIPTTPPVTPPFSRYCTTRLTEVLGSLMAPGYCYVLNMLRDLGILIWFQFLIDVLAGVSVARSLLVTIQFYPLLYNGGRKADE